MRHCYRQEGQGGHPRHRYGGPGRQGRYGYGGPGRRGHRARRGDVRTAILLLLAEEPRNGYGLMQEIEERSAGAWKPSPGSVYPLLAQLEDEGLIAPDESDGRKVLVLTDEGKVTLAERGERPAPWEEFSRAVDDDVRAAFDVFRQVGGAMTQMAQVASADQLVKAREILEETRRSLYGILAEGETETGEDSP